MIPVNIRELPARPGVRWGVRGTLLILCAACVAPAAGVREAPETVRVAAVSRPAHEPWCELEDVLEGPVTAALYLPHRPVYACRIGPSPKFSLLRRVQTDPRLARCLAGIDGSAWAEVSLLVDGAGHVAEVTLEDEEGSADVERCFPVLRAFEAMRLGCRWRLRVTLGSFQLDD